MVPKPVSMLPIPTDGVATQECVGDNAKSPRLDNARPSEKGMIAAKVDVRAPPVEQLTSTNQNGERTWVEPRNLLGSKTIG